MRELGVVGSGAPPTREGAQELRRAFEELGTTYVKLGQLLSSRPELLPDVYIEELANLTDSAPPLPFSAVEPVIAQTSVCTTSRESTPRRSPRPRSHRCTVH